MEWLYIACGVKGFNIYLTMMIYALFMLMLIASPAAAGKDKALIELLSSRDDVVQIAGYGEEKLSTVLITGSVNCEPPYQPQHAWPIQGASVIVKCQRHGKKWKGKLMVAKGVSDEFGEFIIEIPSKFHAIQNLEKVCSVKIQRVPKTSVCEAAHVRKHKGLTLSSFGNGIRTYNAGNIRIQHKNKMGEISTHSR